MESYLWSDPHNPVRPCEKQTLFVICTSMVVWILIVVKKTTRDFFNLKKAIKPTLYFSFENLPSKK